MTIEATLLLVHPACAVAALIMALGRLVYLFAAPYLEPTASAAVRRGPGLRIRLLALGAGILLLGGLLITAAMLGLTSETVPRLLKLGIYFVTVAIVGAGVTLIAMVLAVQNKMVDDHALKEGQGKPRGRVWRTNLLEIALLLGLGAGVMWLSGLNLPDLGDIASLPPDLIEQRLRLFRFISSWAFFAGALTMAIRMLPRVKSAVGAILVPVFIAIAGGVFRWIYGSATPKDYEIRWFIENHGDPAVFRTELLQAETLSLVGLSLCLVLIAAPLLDLILQSAAPSLKNRFGRMLCFVVTFAGCGAVFAAFAPPAGINGALPLPSFLIAAACGTSLALAAPFVVAAIWRSPFATSDWAPPTVIGLGLGSLTLVLAVTPSFQLAAVLLGGAGVIAAGALKREPEAVEPTWADVF